MKVDSGKPTIIFAVKDEESLKLFWPDYGNKKNAAHIAGYYHPSYDKNLALVRVDSEGNGPTPYKTLYHEYTHGFMRINFRGMPVWLDEGLAEFYGNTEISTNQASVGMVNEQQLRLLKANTLIPLSDLVILDRTSPLYNTADHSGIFYAESWALVHYLSLGEGVRDQNLLGKFTDLLQSTDDPIEAANQSFGDLHKFQEHLETYVHQAVYQYRKLPLQTKVPEKDFTAKPLSPAEGLLARADFMLRENNLPTALGLLHQVETLDPKTPGLHSELGYYHYLKADYDNSMKEFQLALSADPEDLDARVYTALTYLRRDGYTLLSTPQIVGHLEKALSLNPQFAPAWAFLSVA